MRPFRRLGLLLNRLGYVRRAIEERADLRPFKARPSFRLMLGVSLIGISMLLGWPAISTLGTLALVLKAPWVAVIGPPLTYGLSWVVYGIAMWISGREALYYAGVFNRWLVRVLVEWMIGPKRP